MVTTVNKISHEYISSVRNFTTLVKQLQQVVELAMDVTANSDRC
jgi:hypothetical protein